MRAFLEPTRCRNPKHSPKPRSKAAETNYKLGTQLPYLFVISRLAHYIKVIQREQLGSWKERSDTERELNTGFASMLLTRKSACRSPQPPAFASG